MSLYSDAMILEVLGKVSEGQPVVTEDGQELGKVVGIEGQCIKVGATLSRDYWLHADSIVGVEDGAVCMCFAKQELNAYKLDKPAVSDDPVVGQEDHIIPVDEQLEQRERMERELEEQRRKREQRCAA